MAILDYSRRIAFDPLCRFGGIEQRMAVVWTPDSVRILNVPNFDTVYRKVYSSARVLDAVLANGIAWVLITSDKSVFIELLQGASFDQPATQKLNLRSSDQVSRLYKLDDAVIVTGPNARVSAFVTESGNKNIPISQAESMQVFPGNLLGVVTGIYGSGSVLKVFRIAECLEELAEVYLRDIFFVTQLEKKLHIVSTDNHRLYCSKLDVTHRRLDADAQIDGVECTFLEHRYKLLGNARYLFGYPFCDFSGLAGINIQKATIDFQVSFGCRAYDIACYENDNRVCVCYVDESGAGANYVAQTTLPDKLDVECELDYSLLGELDLNINESFVDEERSLRLKKLGL